MPRGGMFAIMVATAGLLVAGAARAANIIPSNNFGYGASAEAEAFIGFALVPQFPDDAAAFADMADVFFDTDTFADLDLVTSVTADQLVTQDLAIVFGARDLDLTFLNMIDLFPSNTFGEIADTSPNLDFSATGIVNFPGFGDTLMGEMNGQALSGSAGQAAGEFFGVLRSFSLTQAEADGVLEPFTVSVQGQAADFDAVRIATASAQLTVLPVPEPASALALGTLGLILLRRRR